jgi:Peptidase propeptide and YPEB domain
MWRFIVAVVVALAGAPGIAQAGWFSDEMPPANAKPLSEIIKAIEDKGLKTITDIEFEDEVWNIEAHQIDGKEIRLKVNPITGEIRK